MLATWTDDAGRSVSYRLAGGFVEFCDCHTMCHSWVGEPATEDHCSGAFGWLIEQGDIGGVDVAGLKVVSVSFHSGHRETGGQEVYLFIDERADNVQFDALATVFTGAAGGPLGELDTLLGVLLGTERAAIDITTKGRHSSITVDTRVSGDGEVLVGADREVTELAHGRLSVVLGTPAEVGKSADFRVNLGRQGFVVAVQSRATMRGRFESVHNDATTKPMS